MPQFPRSLYLSARRQYGDRKRYSRGGLQSKRTRLIIRLLAIEEACRELNMAALPPRIVETLRLLADYSEAHKRKVWSYRGVAKEVGIDIPLEDLEMACGHPRPSRPVVAAAQEGDRLFDSGESLRVFVCSEACARQAGRRVYAALHFDRETGPTRGERRTYLP